MIHSFTLLWKTFDT